MIESSPPVIPQLLVATGVVVLTIAIHFFGLAFLIYMMGRHGPKLRPLDSILGRISLLMLLVLALFVIHGLQIWLYAGVYMTLGLFSGFEQALYFSTTTFSTLGYGDVTVADNWRLVAAIEGINGFILIGWSTAFLVSVTAQIKLLETQLEKEIRNRLDD